MLYIPNIPVIPSGLNMGSKITATYSFRPIRDGRWFSISGFYPYRMHDGIFYKYTKPRVGK